MRELDAHFNDVGGPFRPPPDRDSDRSDSESSSDSSSMGFGRSTRDVVRRMWTPQQQIRQAGQTTHSQTAAQSGVKQARLQVAPRPNGLGTTTRVVPKTDYCLAFNSKQARCELKHKCAPRTSESARQQDRAYLLHDQAYQMHLQQRNASIMIMQQHNARTGRLMAHLGNITATSGRPPVQTPPPRAPPSRPPPQGPEYRDAQLAR